MNALSLTLVMAIGSWSIHALTDVRTTSCVGLSGVASKLTLRPKSGSWSPPHWHDDHIRGLAEESCVLLRSAKFVNSAAYALRNLVRVVKLGMQTAPQSSATQEYDGIIKILEQRRKRGERRDAVGPVPALANRKLLSLNSADRSVGAEVIALSPADGVFNLAEAELRNALSAIEQRRRPSRQGPNQLCVVLWLKVGVANVFARS